MLLLALFWLGIEGVEDDFPVVTVSLQHEDLAVEIKLLGTILEVQFSLPNWMMGANDGDFTVDIHRVVLEVGGEFHPSKKGLVRGGHGVSADHRGFLVPFCDRVWSKERTDGRKIGAVKGFLISFDDAFRFVLRGRYARIVRVTKSAARTAVLADDRRLSQYAKRAHGKEQRGNDKTGKSAPNGNRRSVLKELCGRDRCQVPRLKIDAHMFVRLTGSSLSGFIVTASVLINTDDGFWGAPFCHSNSLRKRLMIM